MDITFARILGHIVFGMGGFGRAVTIQCSRCRKVYDVDIEELALAQEDG